jgi:succinate dehydrogenase / fumarate reductase cytochrome b subunit
MANAPRPLSPHMQIYGWHLSMVLSIVHRATGIALAFGTILLVWWLLAAASGPEAFARVSGFMGSFLGVVMLFGWTWALIYHSLNGIRHLVWDVGYGMDIDSVYKSGVAVLGASIGLTVLLWIIGLIIW